MPDHSRLVLKSPIPEFWTFKKSKPTRRTLTWLSKSPSTARNNSPLIPLDNESEQRLRITFCSKCKNCGRRSFWSLIWIRSANTRCRLGEDRINILVIYELWINHSKRTDLDGDRTSHCLTGTDCFAVQGLFHYNNVTVPVIREQIEIAKKLRILAFISGSDLFGHFEEGGIDWEIFV